jgi:hypothetical protein
MSKVEIMATDAAGRVFVGLGDVIWNALLVEHGGTSFQPAAVYSWLITESDGRSIGWLPLPLKQEDDDDKTETEG